MMRLLGTIAAVLVISAAGAIPARANDGFFGGAGDTLYPVFNKSLRVVSEDLEITAVSTPSLSWRAVAVYQVEAREDRRDVLLGFPIATTEYYDGEETVVGDGAWDFKTFVDGKLIPGVERKKLRLLSGKEKPGYVWRLSFAKGRRYELRSEYGFGVDTSNSFYAGREFPEGEPPWFRDKEWFSIGNGFTRGANRVIYYLTPLKQWGDPPPERVSIVVNLPAGVPMHYAVPIKPKPACVGVRSLFYELRGKFPDQDLEVSYPSDTADRKRPLGGRADWEAWRRTLGGPGVRLNCALKRLLLESSGPEAVAELKPLDCAATCRDALPSKL